MLLHWRNWRDNEGQGFGADDRGGQFTCLTIANPACCRHFNSGKSCGISDMKNSAPLRLMFCVATISPAKGQEMRPHFHTWNRHRPLVLTSVFPSFSVTCLCLTCSDICRSNPTFVFIDLFSPLLLSHIRPIFNPVYKI